MTKTSRAISFPANEVRFHTHRLGSRTKVAQLFGVCYNIIYRSLPVTEFDHYLRGMMVNIGGILVKRCHYCGVARELDHYWSNPSVKSGCREKCSYCRGLGNE